jgi:hypothetical protein
VTDGGGALILVLAERARDFPRRPVYLLGTGESVETPMVSQMADFTSSRAFRVAGQKAFAEAGITPKDVDHLMICDAPCSVPGASFAHLPIWGLEDLVPGTARRPTGQARGLKAHGRPGIPLNTNAGGLSYMHSGMYGMYALQESVRQMRGTAPAQIPAPRSRSATASPACSPPPARSSCQTSGDPNPSNCGGGVLPFAFGLTGCLNNVAHKPLGRLGKLHKGVRLFVEKLRFERPPRRMAG